MRSARRIIPAQVPSIGAPAAAKARIGSRSPYSSIILRMVVLSPPGRMSASISARSRGRRTSTGSAPTARIASACSRTAPWTARIPIRGGRLLPRRSMVPGYQPLTASRSSAGMSLSSRPCMGSPSPALTSARMSGLSKWVVALTIARA